MFSLIATAVSLGKALYTHFSGKPIPPSVEGLIKSSTDLYSAVRAGIVRVRDDDGTELTPEQFDAKFAAWEAAQRAAGEGADARIAARHAND